MRFVAITIFALIALGGCATRQPVWQDRERLVNVLSKEIAGLGQEAALQRMLTKSAQIAVDHGYRYFAIVKPVVAANGTSTLPSSNVTIKLFRNNETPYPAPGIWDAYRVLSSGARKS